MSQVSRPLLIGLAAVVVLAGAWLTVLRPKDPSAAPDAPAPAAAASPAPDAATPAPDATTPPAVAAAPAPTAVPPAPAAAPEVDTEAVGQGSARVLDDLERGRVVVLLFWNGRSTDDRATRRAVAGVDRRDGKVTVRVEKLSELGDYAAITNGVRVEQSPTVLVVDRDRNVEAIAGYTVTSELDQAVSDALKRSRG